MAERQVTHFPISHLIGDRNTEEIAADLKVSHRTIQRWIESGVNWEQADIFATTICNLHPITAFGMAWLDAAEADSHVDQNQLTLGDMFDVV